MSIITGNLRSLTRDDYGAELVAHLAGDPELAVKTGEQLIELAPLVSALADGQTDLAEMLAVARELPTVKKLLDALGL